MLTHIVKNFTLILKYSVSRERCVHIIKCFALIDYSEYLRIRWNFSIFWDVNNRCAHKTQLLKESVLINLFEFIKIFLKVDFNQVEIVFGPLFRS